MLARLFPKERDFFPVFDQITARLSDVVSELLNIMNSPEKVQDAVLRTREIEAEVERLARQSIEHLHETFITPFDRIHIFQFVTRLGEIVTFTRLVVEKIQAYELEKLPAESAEIVAKCGELCTLTRKMVGQLRKIKNPSETLSLCMSIYKIRAATDVLFFNASKKLFRNENDIKKLLKIREVNEDLVSIIKKFEGITFLIEEIILEYA